MGIGICQEEELALMETSLKIIFWGTISPRKIKILISKPSRTFKK